MECLSSVWELELPLFFKILKSVQQQLAQLPNWLTDFWMYLQAETAS